MVEGCADSSFARANYFGKQEVILTLEVLGVFFIKTASKQPLFKARYIMQNLSLV
jgi:hypothetical protein